jgi:hypothetical protein
MTPVTTTYQGTYTEYLPRVYLSSSSVRINGKCCACGRRFSLLVRETLKGARGSKGGHARSAVDASGRSWYDPDGSGYWVRCDCGKCLRARPVVGKLNPGIKCNSRCEGATGHVCECSCGGKNHGASAEG